MPHDASTFVSVTLPSLSAVTVPPFEPPVRPVGSTTLGVGLPPPPGWPPACCCGLLCCGCELPPCCGSAAGGAAVRNVPCPTTISSAGWVVTSLEAVSPQQ